MKTYSPIEKLDIVLEYLKRHKSSFPSENLDDEVYKVLNIDKFEYHRIVRKLAKDGYADLIGATDKSVGFYVISFEGECFYGYNEQKQIDDKIRNTNEIVESLRLRNDHRLVLGTWFAGAAAILLLLWQVFLYLYPVHADYPYFFWQK